MKARAIVEGLGADHALDILGGSAAVSALVKCQGIGKATAVRIKEAWDSNKGTLLLHVVWSGCARQVNQQAVWPSSDPFNGLLLVWHWWLDTVCLLPCCHATGTCDGFVIVSGRRAAEDFLKTLGVTSAVSHRLLEKFGTSAEQHICRDPYTTLRIAGGDFRLPVAIFELSAGHFFAQFCLIPVYLHAGPMGTIAALMIMMHWH